MPFDEDPNDVYEHYQCEKCGGSVRQAMQDKTLWECDTCDFWAHGSSVPIFKISESSYKPEPERRGGCKRNE